MEKKNRKAGQTICARGNPTISACMIVKNEEELLPRCLESIKDYVQEIIVVDTGSTDRTVEIANSYGARVYHHPWENNFSKHRNQSLSYATGDWILVLDADEQLAEDQGEKLRAVVTKCSKDTTNIYLVVKDIRNNEVAMVSSSLRLFRNHVGAHYEGVVHNRIIVPKGERMNIDIVLYHYGYGLTSEKMENKFQRTYPLLKQQLIEDPEDLYALYNMATTLSNHDPESAIEYSLRLLSLLKEKGDAPIFYVNIFHVLANCYLKLKKTEKAIKTCLEAINIFPKYVDAYWILCEIYFERKEYPEAILFGNKFLHYYEDYTNHRDELSDLFIYSYERDHEVRLRLGLSFLYEDDWNEGEKHLQVYLSEADAPLEAVQKIIGHLKVHHWNFENVKAKIFSLADTNQPNVQKPLSKPGQIVEAENPDPSISLCMIVKDEEALLPQCLGSVKDWVDEIIVVDTGSRDKTVEIAEGYGAKVFHHSWENDFSKHRNQSISYATGEWIFIMDADEELKRGSGDLIKDAISREDIDSVMVTVLNYFNNKMSQSVINQARLFRNKKGIYYSSPVHNQLIGCKSTITYPIYIYHYGYDLNPEKMKTKFIRTSTLLKQMIKKEPGRFRHHHDLAVCYQSNNMFMEAAAEGSNAIEMAEREGSGNGALALWSHFITAFAYYKLEDLKNAEQYSLKALNKYPEHLDSYFILALVYHRTKDWEKLERSANSYLKILKILWENPAIFGNMINNTANEEWLVRLFLGDLYLERKEEKNANEEFNKAFLITPNKIECNKIMGDIYRGRGLCEKAEDNYRDCLKDNPEYMDALFGLALLNKGGRELAQYQMYLDKLRDMKTDDADILTEIGIDDLRAGRYEPAIRNFKGVLAKRPRDVNACINLALACKHSGQKEDAIGYNLKALGLKVDSIEALTNLGHIYFESEKYTSAKEMYLKAFKSGLDLIDVHLRLAHIHTIEGEIEDCVAECDFLLKTLYLPRNKTLNSIKDLSELFLVIAHTLEQSGKEQLSREALEIAVRLNPDIVS